MLLGRGADNDQKDQDKANPGYTPLITAATRGDLEMVQMFVERGADLSAGDRNGKTALVLAEQRGYTDIGDFLKALMFPKDEEM